MASATLGLLPTDASRANEAFEIDIGDIISSSLSDLPAIKALAWFTRQADR